MGLFEDLGKEYVRHRLYGRHHRRYPASRWTTPGGYWGAPRHGGYLMRRRHHRARPFGAHRRGGVEVRGCGCCLPIPLGLVVSAGLAARLRHVAGTR